MSTLTLIVGPPGLDKSKWINKNRADDDVLVSTSDIRNSLNTSKRDKKTIYAYAIDATEQSLRYGQNVILDMPSFSKHDRSIIIDRVKDIARIKAYYFSIQLDKYIDLTVNDKKLFDRDMAIALYNKVEEPSKEEGIYEIITIEH